VYIQKYGFKPESEALLDGPDNLGVLVKVIDVEEAHAPDALSCGGGA